MQKKINVSRTLWFILQALICRHAFATIFHFPSRLIRTVRRPLSLLLMLFLLLTQQATLSHAVSHLAPAAIAAAAQEATGDSTEFAAHDCDLCVAAAQFAAALPASSVPPLSCAAAGKVHHAFLARGFEAAPALAFRSRAPPFA
jgi:fructose-specific component phosphotransferase system IIB-like protein